MKALRKPQSTLFKSTVVAGLTLAAAQSHAALDAAVTTAMANTSADIAELGVIIIGIAAVAMGFKWLKGMIFG